MYASEAHRPVTQPVLRSWRTFAGLPRRETYEARAIFAGMTARILPYPTRPMSYKC